MTRKLYCRALLIGLFLTLAIRVEGQSLISNDVTFIQGDSFYVVSSESDSIELERKPFSIRYFGKRYNPDQRQFYVAQIAVLDNRKDIGVLTVGMSRENTTYFEPGSGMAPGYNGKYDTLFVSDKGHHYLLYESENDHRVGLISKKANILELEWKISGVNFNQTKNLSFNEMKNSTLYFVILLDRNLDGVIDEGELKVVTVNFKP